MRTEDSLEIQYQCDGSISKFVLPIEYQLEAEVEVRLYDPLVGDEGTVQTNPGDYTIVDNYISFVTAPATNYQVIISRITSRTQDATFPTTPTHASSQVENALDKISQTIQEEKARFNRMSFNNRDFTNSPVLPPEAGDEIIYWDEELNLSTLQLIESSAAAASEAEMQTGTENTKRVSPLRYKQGYNYHQDNNKDNVTTNTIASYFPGHPNKVLLLDNTSNVIFARYPEALLDFQQGEELLYKHITSSPVQVDIELQGFDSLDFSSSASYDLVPYDYQQIMVTNGLSGASFNPGAGWQTIETKNSSFHSSTDFTLDTGWNNTTQTNYHYKTGNTLYSYGVHEYSGVPGGGTPNMTWEYPTASFADLGDFLGAVSADNGAVVGEGFHWDNSAGVLKRYIAVFETSSPRLISWKQSAKSGTDWIQAAGHAPASLFNTNDKFWYRVMLSSKYFAGGSSD